MISRCCERRRRTEEGTAQWAGVIWDRFPGEGGSALFFTESLYCLGASWVKGGGESLGMLLLIASTSLKVTGCLWRKAFLAMGSR